jgi:acylphosphatase
MAPERTAREVVVHGHVQGVFFRDTCQRRAEDVGVAGWVSNEPDGTVRAHFEGTPESVERMVAWAREGPRSADVTEVDVSEAAVEGFDDFEVR